MPSLSQIAHLWANGTDKRYSGSTMFAQDGTIYSYGTHYAIGRYYLERSVVLLNSYGYSCSTQRHKSYVRRAIADSVTWEAIDELIAKLDVMPAVELATTE